MNFPTPTEIIQPAYKLGSIPIYGMVMLAPMDGYTDHPFRLICRRWGSACTYSEFINGMDIENHHPYLKERIFFKDEERPFGFQILDNEPARIFKSARYLLQYNPDFLDINLGCSSRTVCVRGAGASLLLDPSKITFIIQTLTREVEKPITAKIRLGWDDDHRNFLEVSKRIQDAGAAAIVVHGRTKIQAYNGEADWQAIAEIKQILHIPVIGNGDIQSATDIPRFLEYTKCDAAMIGRAAIGNPWIFGGKDRSDRTPEELLNTIQGHLQGSMDYYGIERGLTLFRKQLVQYLKNYWPSTEFRRDVLTTSDPKLFLEKIKSILL